MVYCRFFQFWLIFPNRNLKSRSIGYNFNWCWQHALHLKKKTLPIFENLVTTSRTTTKVVSCLKIPLTSMCVVVRTSSPGPDFINSSPPPQPPNWSFNPLKKLFFSQCWRLSLQFLFSITKGWKINERELRF